MLDDDLHEASSRRVLCARSRSMNLPALATPMSAIASGKGSLKIGAPASSRFARTSTSSRRPAGFMAMGGVCPDANLIQRLSAPVWARRRKFSPAGKGWVRVSRGSARRLWGDSLSGSPWLVQKDGSPSGRPSACWILPVGEGGAREADRVSGWKGRKGLSAPPFGLFTRTRFGESTASPVL